MLRAIAGRVQRAPASPAVRRGFATSAARRHTPLSVLSTAPEFFSTVREGTIPAFRLLGADGQLTEDAGAKEWVDKARAVDGDKLKRMLEVMTMMPILVRTASLHTALLGTAV